MSSDVLGNGEFVASHSLHHHNRTAASADIYSHCLTQDGQLSRQRQLRSADLLESGRYDG